MAMLVNPVGLTDAEVRASLAQMEQAVTMQDQDMTAQVNQQDVQRENPSVLNMVDRLRDFTRMNPLIFTGSKTSDDPQVFVDEVYKIMVDMEATNTEKIELVSYKLKDVAQTWCKIWQDSHILGGLLVICEMFKIAFMERFFPIEMREAKVEEFINIQQASMTVREYSLKFDKLSSRDEMSMLLTGINGNLEEECRSAMLDLSRLMVHVHQVEESRKRRGVRDVRRPRSQNQAGPAMEAIETILASLSSPGSRRGKRVFRILTLRGVQHLEEPNINPRGAMVVRCSVLGRFVLCLVELIVESVDRALMPASVVVRVDTWSETVHITEVRLEELTWNQLYAKSNKSEFWLRLVTFLGHVVSVEGVEVDPKKTDVVKNCPKPLTPTDFRNFWDWLVTTAYL
ncbi:uncharacterized protein [Solanum lycopersicum]|uniref:uncharacterized protein n=1 Tax=Solanum lycopersicum TaxID=4081 RepID=UPI0037492FA9